MIALGWNCRGLGNLWSVRVLGELVQWWNSKIVFLSETKIRKKAMENLMEKINFVNGLIVPRRGRGGGLALLGKREIDLEIMGYSRSFIDAIITKQDSGFKWRITGFYGNPETYRRKESWEELKVLYRKFNLLWLCYCDFNEILSGKEKLGKWSMFVVLKTWDIMARTLRGVICKKGKIVYI